MGASYGEAMAEATADQQNVMRERFVESLGYLESLLKNSNPLATEANKAKQNAAELDEIKKMTVRQFMIHYVGKQEKALAEAQRAVNYFVNENGLELTKLDLEKLTPSEITEATRSVELQGIITLKNNSKDFDFDFRGCQLALSLDGVEANKLADTNDCKKWEPIIKGGSKEFTFTHSIKEFEQTQKFARLLQNEEEKKITWKFAPSGDSYVRGAAGQVFQVNANELAAFEARATKAQADIALLQK
ncbi:hypothetical protein CY658_03080 [Variovorax sp. RO1]|nr:hypothetical protein CY658_03080 [Variovorax sp. RO1]